MVIAPKHNVSWLARADRVDNYPGLKETSGADLLQAFGDQAAAMGVETLVGMVRQILPMDGGFMLLVENDVVEAKTIVFTTGATKPKLLPGEEALIGAGVSYCATCDGQFLPRQERSPCFRKTSKARKKPNFLQGIAGEMDYYPLQEARTPAEPARRERAPGQPGARRTAESLWKPTGPNARTTACSSSAWGMPLAMLLEGLQMRGRRASP